MFHKRDYGTVRPLHNLLKRRNETEYKKFKGKNNNHTLVSKSLSFFSKENIYDNDYFTDPADLKEPQLCVCKMVNVHDVSQKGNVKSTARVLANIVQCVWPPGLGGIMYRIRKGSKQQRDLEMLNELNKVPTPRWPFHVSFLTEGPDDPALLGELAEEGEGHVHLLGTHGRGLSTHAPRTPAAHAATLARLVRRLADRSQAASMGQGAHAQTNVLNIFSTRA